MSLFPTSRDLRLACADIARATANYHLWYHLGVHEIRQRYRRSTLGPFWLTITTGINILAIGLISSSLFGTSVRDHLPYLAVSIVVWNLVSTYVTEAGYIFIHSAGYIKQLRQPLFAYVLWMTWRNFVIFGHNIVIFFVVVLVFGLSLGFVSLLSVLGLALLAINLIWIALLLGVLSTRFRDIPITVQSLLTVMFFVTPIFWRVDQLGTRRWIADINPLTHLLDVVRQPLLGEVPSLFAYGMVVGCAIAGWCLAVAAFSRFRARVPYWL